MSDIQTPGEAVIRRRIDNGSNLILSMGDFAAMSASWERHATLWEGEPDGLSVTMMRQALASASLHLSNRPRNETVAWTLNIRQPPTNVFVTGHAGEGTVAGRAMSKGVKTEDHSRLFVQVLRDRAEPYTSVLEVHGYDVLDIFEQYYLRSEQNPARFYPLGDETTLMLMGLPGVDRGWIGTLGGEEARSLYAAARPLDERVFRFACGCTPEKILAAVRAIYRDDPDDLFQEDDKVEVFCPRCGRRWWIDRTRFSE